MISRNEEAAVGKVIKDIQAALSAASILIVDSSEDRTAEITTELGAEVLKQYPPWGYERAMDLALRSAQTQVVVTMDCDDTYPVDYIQPLARMIIEDGYDLVDGCRLERKPRNMPGSIIWGTGFSRLWLQFFSGAASWTCIAECGPTEMGFRKAWITTSMGRPSRWTFCWAP